MKISYANSQLQKLCDDERKATQKLGADSAQKLRNRIDDLVAAEKLADVRVGKPHPLVGDLAGCFAFSLAGGWRLVLRPIDAPLNKTGDIDWPAVRSVQIYKIENYHD